MLMTYSVTLNLSSLEKQVDIIQSFTSENSLAFNLEKLELLAMSKDQNPPVWNLTVQQCTLSSSATASCLDVVWSHNLSPKLLLIALSIKQEELSLAWALWESTVATRTASEAIQACVMPICLYGSENWLLTGPLLQTLEAFQSKIGKRILKLPSQFAGLCPLVSLDWPTMHYRILTQKLGFFY